MKKNALITGITGQDGAYLAAFLLKKGYRVVGLAPRRSGDGTWRLRELGIVEAVELVYGDIIDLSSIMRGLEFPLRARRMTFLIRDRTRRRVGATIAAAYG